MRKALTADKITGPKIKANKPCTSNPGIKTAANQKQKPFTMNEKPPKLKIFRGMDKVDKIGLIKALTPPIAAAAIKAATKVDKFTPGTTNYINH
ncbi:MAG TPA: hypothetical protein V6D21_17000 [Candidatus Obscuribacterales bacterium]